MKTALLSIFPLCISFLYGCSAEEKNINSPPITTDQVSVSNITHEAKTKESYKQFFLLSKDLQFDKDLHQLEAIWPGKLILHNNCLSILVESDKETIHTLVVPKNYEIIFDKQNNIAGLKDSKSKEQYKLGESLLFGGLAIDKEKMKPIKNIPSYCEPRLALPGDIKK
ncbi:hypothetical protein [Acinetobacter calcoaceticus]|uniref:hypothetical protein n=1 Tax=Acinetobacter calcoaceticus TaxID=471 RepID=UPI002273695B|nr:hypothetical protein [Acinetobacter calcoaceticus]GLG82226.1 hypothetical protein ACSO1_07480 [Acinetobacter calcoaceticus]